MRILTLLLLLVVTIVTVAIPLEHDLAHRSDIEIPNIPFGALIPDGVSGNEVSVRYRCGSFKFDDNTTQDMVSQAWNNRPVNEQFCRPIKYTLARVDGKAGKDANMVGAKIDKGCVCFFYEYVFLGCGISRWLTCAGHLATLSMPRPGRAGKVGTITYQPRSISRLGGASSATSHLEVQPLTGMFLPEVAQWQQLGSTG